VLVLPPPSTVHDYRVLKQLCKELAWAPHEPTWEAAYTAYLSAAGDPHLVTPATFDPEVDDAQRALYDKRKHNGPIRRIRDAPSALCCPMCGSGSVGSVDHYLPRVDYPEFSVFGPNLVPACSHCNSTEKGSIYKGDAPERFLHPYFDTVAHSEVWRIRFEEPYAAPSFHPALEPGVTGDDAIRAEFHLQHALGKEFRRVTANRWTTFPKVLREELQGDYSPARVRTLVETRVRAAQVSTGLNSWETAFYRGLFNDHAVQAWLAGQAAALPGRGLVQLR